MLGIIISTENPFPIHANSELALLLGNKKLAINTIPGTS